MKIKKLQPSKITSQYVVIIFMITLFVFMNLVNLLLIKYQKDHHIAEKKINLQNELDLVGVLLKEKMYKREYSAFEEIVAKWNYDSNFFIEIKVVAKDGYLLALRKSAKLSNKIFKLSKKVFDRDNHLFTIDVIVDLEPFDEMSVSLILRLIFISLLITILLGIILWYIFDKLAISRLRKEISFREKAENELRMRTYFLTSVIESLTYPFYVIDVNTHEVIMGNKASGWNKEKKGIACHLLTHHQQTPCLSDEHICPIEMVKKTNKAVVVEHLHYTDNDELRNVEVHGFPIFNEEGDLIQMIEYSIDITSRKHLENQIRDSRAYFQKIIESTQSGLIIINAKSLKVISANNYACNLLKLSLGEIIGHEIIDFFPDQLDFEMMAINDVSQQNFEDCICVTKQSEKVKVRVSVVSIYFKNVIHFLISFVDVTDIHELLEKQNINIFLAKNVLSLINSKPSRYEKISEKHELFIDSIIVPYHKEGGDHFFVRTIRSDISSKEKTHISIKDQSGHEVSCVLKSIITDLIHNSILMHLPESLLEDVLFKLNNDIFNSNLMPEDSFMTAFNAEIEHGTLNLRYSSSGHPSAILIRNNSILFLPENAAEGANLPFGVKKDATFKVNELKLKEGDQLIFYTDGLIEMPFKNKKYYLGNDDLKKIIEEILGENKNVHVSDIINSLLNKVAEISEEKVLPFVENTSDDDVTILGMEIENKKDFQEMSVIPHSLKECEDFILMVYNKLKEEWDLFGYDNHEIRLKTVLEESILNAWKHGNAFSKEMSINVLWKKCNDFHLQVIDQGEGFSYNSIPDPRETGNKEKPSGRGLFLMKHVCDLMYWNDKGNKVSFVFKKKAKPLKKITNNKININIWNK